jgi:membrane protein YdbS with pleckstrin-like domain
MPDKTIVIKPSQWINLGVFLSTPLLITIPLALHRYLYLKKYSITITRSEVTINCSNPEISQKIIPVSAIIGIKTEQTIFQRVFNICNIEMQTSSEAVTIPAVKPEVAKLLMKSEILMSA